MRFSGEMAESFQIIFLLQNTTWVTLQVLTGLMKRPSYNWDGWYCEGSQLHKDGLPGFQYYQ